MPPRLRPALAVPGFVALSAAAAVAQAYRAGYRRDLPAFEGFDASGSFGDPTLPRLDVVVLGDSALTGQGLEGPDDIWIRQVCRRLSLGRHVVLTSFAAGGSRARDVLAFQIDRAAALAPDIALVVVGTNDITHVTPPRLLEAQLFEIVDRLAIVSRAVLLPGMGDMGTVPRVGFPLTRLLTGWSAYVDLLHTRAAAAHRNVWKIPMRSLTIHDYRTRPEVFCSDRYHPSIIGHQIWAEAAYPSFEAVALALESDPSGRPHP